MAYLDLLKNKITVQTQTPLSHNVKAKFNYLLEKIMDAPLQDKGFPVIYIEDWFNQDDFDMIINSKLINLPKYPNTEELINGLEKHFYKIEPFPGTIPEKQTYLDWYNGAEIEGPEHAFGLIEGFGLVFRLDKCLDKKLRELLDFLASEYFVNSLKDKFNLYGNTLHEVAIQKYLSGYEISPHPDVRKKLLTMMVNINPSDQLTNLDVHTHFMKFKERFKKIYDYWDKDQYTERNWVPWDWCETAFIQNKNNSITMFSPSNLSLHAVKMYYEHCKSQRTQIYANIWNIDSQINESLTWTDLIEIS